MPALPERFKNGETVLAWSVDKDVVEKEEWEIIGCKVRDGKTIFTLRKTDERGRLVTREISFQELENLNPEEGKLPRVRMNMLDPKVSSAREEAKPKTAKKAEGSGDTADKEKTSREQTVIQPTQESKPAGQEKRGGKKEIFKLTIVDASDIGNAEIRDRVEREMEAESAAMGRWRRTLANVDIFAEQKRAFKKMRAKGDLKQSDNLYAGLEETTAASDAAKAALVERFASEYETIHDSIGGGKDREKISEIRRSLSGERQEGEKEKDFEKRHTQTEALKAQIRELVMDYAGGGMPDEAFKEASKRVLDPVGLRRIAPDVVAEGLVFASNLFDIARAVRSRVEHGERLEDLDLDFDITLGRAKEATRTKTELTAFERVFHKLGQVPVLGAVVNENTLAVVATVVAVKVAEKGLQMGARSAGNIVLPLIGGALVAGGLTAKRKSRELKERRAQAARERARGEQLDEGAESLRGKIEQFDYRENVRSARELTERLETALYQDGELRNLSVEELMAAIALLADIEARIELSDTQQIDLIGYSDARQIYQEETRLDILRARAKVDLRKLLAGDIAQYPLEGTLFSRQELDEFFETYKDVQNKEEILDNLSQWLTFKHVAQEGLSLGGDGEESIEEYNERNRRNAEAILSAHEGKENRPRIQLPGGADLDSFLRTVTDASKSVIGLNVENQDIQFDRMRRGMAAKAGVKGAFKAAVFGFAFQELAALASPGTEGFVEHLIEKAVGADPQMGAHKATLLAHWAGFDKLSHEFVPSVKDASISGLHLALPQGATATGSAGDFSVHFGNTTVEHLSLENGALSARSLQALHDHGMSTMTAADHIVHESHTAALSPREYVESHSLPRIHRDMWFHDQKIADQNFGGQHYGNELRLWPDGHGGYTTEQLTADGSYTRDLSIDARDLMQQGKLKLLVSLSRETQDKPFIVDIDSAGHPIIEPGSPLEALVRAHGGNLLKLGEYTEIARSVGVDAAGEEHFQIIATDIGPGIASINEGVARALETIPRISIWATAQGEMSTELPPIIPIFSQQQLERGEKAREDARAAEKQTKKEAKAAEKQKAKIGTEAPASSQKKESMSGDMAARITEQIKQVVGRQSDKDWAEFRLGVKDLPQNIRGERGEDTLRQYVDIAEQLGYKVRHWYSQENGGTWIMNLTPSDKGVAPAAASSREATQDTTPAPQAPSAKDQENVAGPDFEIITKNFSPELKKFSGDLNAYLGQTSKELAVGDKQSIKNFAQKLAGKVNELIAALPEELHGGLDGRVRKLLDTYGIEYRTIGDNGFVQILSVRELINGLKNKKAKPAAVAAIAGKGKVILKDTARVTLEDDIALTLTDRERLEKLALQYWDSVPEEFREKTLKSITRRVNFAITKGVFHFRTRGKDRKTLTPIDQSRIAAHLLILEKLGYEPQVKISVVNHYATVRIVEKKLPADTATVVSPKNEKDIGKAPIPPEADEENIFSQKETERLSQVFWEETRAKGREDEQREKIERSVAQAIKNGRYILFIGQALRLSNGHKKRVGAVLKILRERGYDFDGTPEIGSGRLSVRLQKIEETEIPEGFSDQLTEEEQTSARAYEKSTPKTLEKTNAEIQTILQKGNGTVTIKRGPNADAVAKKLAYIKRELISKGFIVGSTTADTRKSVFEIQKFEKLSGDSSVSKETFDKLQDGTVSFEEVRALSKKHLERSRDPRRAQTQVLNELRSAVNEEEPTLQIPMRKYTPMLMAFYRDIAERHGFVIGPFTKEDTRFVAKVYYNVDISHERQWGPKMFERKLAERYWNQIEGSREDEEKKILAELEKYREKGEALLPVESLTADNDPILGEQFEMKMAVLRDVASRHGIDMGKFGFDEREEAMIADIGKKKVLDEVNQIRDEDSDERPRSQHFRLATKRTGNETEVEVETAEFMTRDHIPPSLLISLKKQLLRIGEELLSIGRNSRANELIAINSFGEAPLIKLQRNIDLLEAKKAQREAMFTEEERQTFTVTSALRETAEIVKKYLNANPGILEGKIVSSDRNYFTRLMQKYLAEGVESRAPSDDVEIPVKERIMPGKVAKSVPPSIAGERPSESAPIELTDRMIQFRKQFDEVNGKEGQFIARIDTSIRQLATLRQEMEDERAKENLDTKKFSYYKKRRKILRERIDRLQNNLIGYYRAQNLDTEADQIEKKQLAHRDLEFRESIKKIKDIEGATRALFGKFSEIKLEAQQEVLKQRITFSLEYIDFLYSETAFLLEQLGKPELAQSYSDEKEAFLKEYSIENLGSRAGEPSETEISPVLDPTAANEVEESYQFNSLVKQFDKKPDNKIRTEIEALGQEIMESGQSSELLDAIEKWLVEHPKTE